MSKCEDCRQDLTNKGYILDCEGSSPICEDCCKKYEDIEKSRKEKELEKKDGNV